MLYVKYSKKNQRPNGAKKINPVEIERKSGLSRNTVYSILAGNSKNPSAANLNLIAKALGVTLESILIDEGKIQISSLSE